VNKLLRGLASSPARRAGPDEGTALAHAESMALTALQMIPQLAEDVLPTPMPPARPLTPREKQVLALLASGRTPKEVAFELGNSHATVRVLYSRAMAKLRHGRRSAA
jgi:DNA-binding NarL/FixJ family response regulator